MGLKLRHINDESGMTLVIVIVLAAVALIIMSGLIYMATSGTEVSGMGKRYSTALEAAVGGTDAARGLIDSRDANNFKLPAVQATFSNALCTNTKLLKPTSEWTTNGCPANSYSWTIGAGNYDMSLSLGNYTVYAKIVDTIPGNTAAATGLEKTGVVEADSGTLAVPAVPYIYTIETLSKANTPERSKVSAVYEY
ncbi:MAG: hypothetical protein M0Z58_09740 [Nitrospiraceae bacterium]|nr:hypothetical protein [Nitrospiraceae bacterium]